MPVMGLSESGFLKLLICTLNLLRLDVTLSIIVTMFAEIVHEVTVIEGVCETHREGPEPVGEKEPGEGIVKLRVSPCTKKPILVDNVVLKVNLADAPTVGGLVVTCTL
jgi:hypothetical protein